MLETELAKLIGERLRQRRLALGLSQKAIADALCISFQQVQKYEKGTNIIGISRLCELSNYLGVPTTYFYKKDYNGEIEELSTTNSGLEVSEVSQRQILALMKAFSTISNTQIRQRLVELTRSLSAEADPQ